jgi:phosphatidate cytidylyltransferase
MIKGRILIYILGIPAWLFLIWKGEFYYTLFILICTVLALGEFYSIIENNGAQPLRWMGMISAVFIADYYYRRPDIILHEMQDGVIAIGGIIVIIILTCIWELFSEKDNPGQNISATLGGILFIPVLLGTAIDLRQFDDWAGTQLTLTLVLAIWACDTVAFILGTLFGTKKIFPSVSPKKSWIGSISGLVASLGVFITFHNQGWLGDYFSLKDAIVFGIITGFFGQIGDFLESSLKRDAGVKDSGTLLAGHGGVLDRFDSLIFATPLAYLYVHFLMHF